MKTKMTPKMLEALEKINKAQRTSNKDFHKKTLKALEAAGVVEIDILSDEVISIDHPPYAVRVLYNYSCTGGEPCDYEDNDGPYCDREDEYYDYYIQGVVPHFRYKQGREMSNYIEVDFEPKEGDTVHLVVVNYDSGSTFGRTCGHLHFEGVYKDGAEADKIAQSIAGGTYKGHKSWDGYFEHYNHVTVEPFTLGMARRKY